MKAPTRIRHVHAMHAVLKPKFDQVCGCRKGRSRSGCVEVKLWRGPMVVTLHGVPPQGAAKVGFASSNVTDLGPDDAVLDGTQVRDVNDDCAVLQRILSVHGAEGLLPDILESGPRLVVQTSQRQTHARRDERAMDNGGRLADWRRRCWTAPTHMVGLGHVSVENDGIAQARLWSVRNLDARSSRLRVD
ncbi:hypothetical protein LZ32DRAFT_393987 [Colletotrichum eremochloae]|nr:hypothetical protein LZ32DRAFT_393987 [Colletotrichum eremochloae]